MPLSDVVADACGIDNVLDVPQDEVGNCVGNAFAICANEANVRFVTEAAVVAASAVAVVDTTAAAAVAAAVAAAAS